MKRWRLWVIVGAIVVLGAVLVTQLRTGSDRALDPASARHSGSKALASVLRGYGVHVGTSTAAESIRGRVVVTDPDAYSAEQLHALDERADLVLLAPSNRVLRALALPLRSAVLLSGPTAPDCAWPGAPATGTVDLPADTIGYTGDAAACYGGAVGRGAGWAVLGSSSLLRNDVVSRTGVAALDVNTITEDRTITDVTWLLTGTAARSTAAPTTWALFPDGARRAFIWLAALGLVLVLWRGRRFGPVISEPLPVIVRATEVVEGHGRLYLRAGARERAAVTLREGALFRLGARLGRPRNASATDVVEALAARTHRDRTTLWSLLAGPPPRDDAGLLELALALDELETAAGAGELASPDPLSKGHAP